MLHLFISGGLRLYLYLLVAQLSTIVSSQFEEDNRIGLAFTLTFVVVVSQIDSSRRAQQSEDLATY